MWIFNNRNGRKASVYNLTLRVSSKTGLRVCFFTLVFRFPLFDLSGSKYTFTYLPWKTQACLLHLHIIRGVQCKFTCQMASEKTKFKEIQNAVEKYVKSHITEKKITAITYAGRATITILQMWGIPKYANFMCLCFCKKHSCDINSSKCFKYTKLCRISFTNRLQKSTSRASSTYWLYGTHLIVHSNCVWLG